MAASPKTVNLNPFVVEAQARAYAEFERKCRGIDSDLKKVINRKINRMLQDMAGSRGVSGAQRVIGVADQPNIGLPHWKPLGAKYVKKKGNNLFFENTGDLRREVFENSSIDLVKLFGGYNNRSFKAEKVEPLTKQDMTKYREQIKNGKVNAYKPKYKFSFTIFGKLSRIKRPEKLLDRFGKSDVSVSEKLGLTKRGYTKYYRSVLTPYASYYVKKVIPQTVRNYFNRQGKNEI